MAFFIDKDLAVIQKILRFPAVTNSTMNLFACKSGERAGFQILDLPQTDGSVFRVSQIWDYTKGAPVLLGSISVVPGLDLAGGMFSSACFCSGDPLDVTSAFYLVDYV